MYQLPFDKVMVSQRSYDDPDPYEIISSNISVVNALYKEFLRTDEQCSEAIQSYLVDYYLAQIENGGFSQFVYNSKWRKETIQNIRDGLIAIGANQHLVLFERGARQVQGFDSVRLDEYFSSEYFGTNEDRDELNEISDEFYQLSKTEDLIVLNSAWLRSLPNLLVLPIAEMEKVVTHLAALVPEREARIKFALDNEPAYMKHIRALCKQASHLLSHVTAGTSIQLDDGSRQIAWHFHTDQGHFYMIDTDSHVSMYYADSHALLTRIDHYN